MQQLVQKLGLATAIDGRLQLLKVHQPHREFSHLLSLDFRTLPGVACVEHLDLLRTGKGLLNVLRARRVPDPGTGWRLLPTLHADGHRHAAGRV